MDVFFGRVLGELKHACYCFHPLFPNYELESKSNKQGLEDTNMNYQDFKINIKKELEKTLSRN